MPYGKSPNKMGHSPAEMESAKQERKNLMMDNPVAKHASWMSKHAQHSRMSPLNQTTIIDSDELKNEQGQTQSQVMADRKASVDESSKKMEDFQNKIKDFNFSSQDQVDKANKKSNELYNKYSGNIKAYNKSLDSIGQVNTNFLANKNKAFNDLMKD